MKKIIVISATLFLAGVTLSFADNKNNKTNAPSEQATFEIPKDVQEIIDNSCYGCHNSDSKNQKGKLKLNFDKLAQLNTGKLVGKLKKTHDAVVENDMPPKKFLQNYPERALTDEQKEKLSSWALNLANEYGGE